MDHLDDAIDVARSSLGRFAPWLTIDAAHPGSWSDGAMTLADLVADDGAGIDRVLQWWDQLRPGDPGGAPGVIGTVAWALFHPQLVAVREARKLITVDVTRARVDLFGDDDDPTRVWWPTDTQIEPVGDDEGDVEAAYRHLVGQAVVALEPLVELVRTQVSLGRRGLWAHVVGTFNGVGPDYVDPDPDRLSAELVIMERARAGSPLAQRAVLLDLDRPDGRRRLVRTSACCLAYLAPYEPDEDDPRPWANGPWISYCTRCPLIPEEETIARAHYWLDEKER
ncbi:MAG: hypothetical protein ACE367_10165 [Acidimicrobiales bacterium]